MIFSLLIANFNNEKYFKECYESIINQTYKDFEVIIVDDASTDDSIEIITALIKDDNRFRLYRNDANKGVGHTKRRLVELANGEICGFVDADDSLVNNAIEITINEYLKNNKIVATYSQFHFCNENLNPIKISKLTKSVSINDRYFFNLDHRIAHFFSFKKNIYDKTQGINPDLRIAEDQDLYLKIYEQGKFKLIKKVLYNYRVHTTGVTHSMKKEKSKEYMNIVIQNAMKRRNIKMINGKKIEGITDVLSEFNYQSSYPYKIKEKIKLIFGI